MGLSFEARLPAGRPFADELDLAGRRIVDGLVDRAPRVPVHGVWDAIHGRPRIRLPLLRGWPFRPFRLVLSADSSAAPPRWALELELETVGGGAITQVLAGWRASLDHDATIGWTRGTRELAGRTADFDGLALWALAAGADEPPSVRVVSTLAHVFDLSLAAGGGLLGVRASAGRIDVELDGAGRLARVILTHGQGREELARLNTDNAGLVRSLHRLGGPPLTLDYDAAGRPTAIESADGSTRRYAYLDEHEGRIGWARLESSSLGAWELTQPRPGVLLAVERSRGALWATTFDGAGRLVEERSPASAPVRIERDPSSGAPVELLMGDYRRQFYYDHDGFIVLADDSNGLSTELRHDEAGRIVLAEQGERQLLRRAFDLTGRLVASSRGGKLVELGWSADGQCHQVSEPDGTRVLSWSGGKLVQSARGTSVWRAERGPLGRISALHGPEGETLSLRHDHDGRLRQWRSSEGWARALRWHASGGLEGVRDEGGELALELDAAGPLAAIPAFDLRVERGADGTSLRVTGAGVDETHEGLDSRHTAVTRDGAVELLVSDELGRLVERRAGGRPDLTLAWTAAGNLARVEGAEIAPEPTRDLRGPARRTRAWRFDHDAAGELVRAEDGESEVAFRRVGGLIVEEVRAAERVAIVRSDAGRRVLVRSSRGLEVELRRDAAHRVVHLTARCDGAALEVSFEYDHAGRELARRFGDGVEMQLLRDSLGRLTRRRVVHGGRSVDHAEYVYRGARLASVEGAGDARRWTFEHDSAGTLTALTGAGEPAARWEGTFRGHSVEGASYDPSGRPLAREGVVYTHDPAGRRAARREGPAKVTRYGYDPFDRLTRIDAPSWIVTHTYDALGRRISTVRTPKPALRSPALDDERPPAEVDAPASEARVDYVWDGDALLHEASSAGPRVAYVHADGLLVAEIIDGAVYFVLPGLSGDVEGLLASDGGLAWARRPETLLTGALDEAGRRLRAPAIPGHHLDPLSGLWFCLGGDRGDLDPETGRYLTPSPSGLAAGPWRYARLPDPISAPASHAARGPLWPFAGLALESAAATWGRQRSQALSCREDEAGHRAWATLADDPVLDPEALLLQSS